MPKIIDLTPMLRGNGNESPVSSERSINLAQPET